MVNTVDKEGIEGTDLNIIKATYDKPTVNIMLSNEKLKDLLLRSGLRKGVYSQPFYSR